MNDTMKNRTDYRAYDRFNKECLGNAKNHMVQKYGENWFCQDPNQMSLSISDLQQAATVFHMGFDMISVNDDSLRPMISDYTESYKVKRMWIDYMNKQILDMFEKRRGDSEVFIKLYTSFDKERWGGMEQWKILSHGPDHGNLIMSALKNFCWFRHMEGRTITFKTAEILDSIFHNSLYWTFDNRIKVLWDESATEDEIYSILKNEDAIVSNFVRGMLLCKQPEAYQAIANEVHSRFPDEFPAKS